MNEHIGGRLGALNHIIRRTIDQFTEEYNLTGPQAKILHYIAKESNKKAVFQRDIENDFHIRRSSITSLVQQLEKAELIERVSVEADARLKKLIVTEKGKQVEIGIGLKIDEFDHRLATILKEDKDAFLAQLDYLIEELLKLEIRKREE